MRARPRDADGHHGRHGTRRAAGDPDQGRAGAGATRRVDTVVLDKTGTVTEGAERWSTWSSPRQSTGRALRIVGALEHAPSIPSRARSRAAADDPLEAVVGFRACEGLGAKVSSTAAVVVGRPALLAELGREPSARPRCAARERHHGRRRGVGRRGARSLLRRRHGEAVERSGGAELHALGLDGPADGRQRADGPRDRGRGRYQRRGGRRAPGRKAAAIEGLQDGARGRDGRRRRQRRAGARAGRSRARARHRHRRRDRGERPDARSGDLRAAATQSASRGGRSRRSRAISSGRSPTTSRPSRSPRSAS